MSRDIAEGLVVLLVTLLIWALVGALGAWLGVHDAALVGRVRP